MHYVYEENEHFGFKDDAINEITDNDVVISDEIYDHFFAEQSKGKTFRIKNIHGDTFYDIFEEYTPIYTPSTEEKIESLKRDLSETDYQIIKCYEYNLCGMELPYDIIQLHINRQRIRDEINALEESE